jgi:site-specific recombinase XerC
METQSLQSIKHMKTRHVQKYFEQQKQRGLSASTLENHATAMRFLALAIGKQNIVPRTNQELGIVRTGRYNPNFSDPAGQELLREALYMKHPALGVAHDLREAFGLRAQESITARVVNRCGEELIRVVGKGGRVREVPVDTPEKSMALLTFKQFVKEQGTPGVIPPEMTLKQFYTYQKNAVYRAGSTNASMSNMHRLRHQRAQKMEQDGKTDKEIAEEYGHGREDSARFYTNGRR